MLEFIKNLINLPVWSRLTIDVTVLIYFFYVKSLLASKEYSKLLPLVIAIIIRDVLSIFILRSELFIVTDLFIFAFLAVWSRIFLSEKSKLLGFYIFFSIYAVMLVVSLIFDPFMDIIIFLLRIPMYIYITVMGFHLHRLSVFNTDNPEAHIVINVRKSLIFWLIVINSLLLIAGETSAISLNLIHPASVFIYLYFFHSFLKYKIKADGKKISTLTDDLASLFDFIKTIGNAISERQDIETILDYITTSTAKNLNADGGAILLIDNYDYSIRVESIYGIFPPPFQVIDQVKTKLENMENFFRNKTLELGESVLGESIQEAEPIYIKNTYNDERMVHNTKNDLMFISSIIIVPLVASSKLLGALAVCQRDRNKLFSEADFSNMRTFADYTSITLDNFFTYMELLDKKEMEREVGIAADIQQKLLPSRIPKIKNTLISAFTKPAKGVSGDYYDIIKLKSGGIALVMCDVAGKGVPASLVMIMIRTIIQLIASAAKSAGTIVSWINRGITGKIDIDHFATLSFLKYDPDKKAIEYSNAGHHPLMLYRAKTKTFENIDTPGLPIGIEQATEYTQKSVVLEKGDIALLYTDGIIEAMNPEGEQYSYESLEKYVKDNYTLSSEELVTGIYQDIQKFVGKAKQHDDQTLLALKIT